jgi:hypothetical protein
MKKRAALFAVSVLAFTTLAYSQDKSQRPSPPAHEQCKCSRSHRPVPPGLTTVML